MMGPAGDLRVPSVLAPSQVWILPISAKIIFGQKKCSAKNLRPKILFWPNLEYTGF